MPNEWKPENYKKCKDKTTIKKIENAGEQCDDSQSGPSNIAYSGDNEEEYLRSTFSRLGVGLDGFLSLEELTKVCHAIGMDKVASEVIDQLFSRLDVDGDGRISFEEFLHMFQNGGPENAAAAAAAAAASSSLPLDESLSQEPSIMSNSPSSCLPSVGNTGSFVTEFGLFSSLDPEGSGCISVSRLVEAWFSVGLSDGERLLRDLGLPHRRGEKLRIRDLGAVMEEEFRPQQESPTPVPRQVALLTLLHEIKWLRTNLECARGERDKYRWDLGEANHRIALFAQELDDQNAAMEKNSQNRINELERNYKEQVRDLQEALSRERDNGRETALSDSRELVALNSRLQEEETRLKGRLTALEVDLKKLEVENLELTVKLNESRNLIQNYEKQVHELNHLREKVAEYESLSPREEEFRKLASKVEELLGENQRLRDNNDELIAQVDSYSSRITMTKHEDYSLDGSCIGDYLDNSSSEGTLGGVKRRGGTSPSRKSSPEEGGSTTDDDESSPRGSKIRKKSSSRIHFHYLDVASHDESFLDGSFTATGHPLQPPLCLASSSTPEKASLQPSSLPPYLHSADSPHLRSNRERIEEKLVGAKNEEVLVAEENALRRVIKELENEIKLLKKEKEEMVSQVLSQNQSLLLLRKEETTEDDVQKSECAMTVRSCDASSNQSTRSPASSTSIKKFRQKCRQCYELESRLNLALEELEMALKREKQSITSKSQDHDVAMNRMQLLINHCQELEEELAQMKTKVLHLIEEKNQLHLEKEEWSTNSSSLAERVSQAVRASFQEISSKMKKKRTTRNFASSLDSSSSSVVAGGGRETIPTIIEEEEEEEEEDSGEDKEEERKLDGKGEEGLERLVKSELEKMEREVNALEERWGRERDHLEKQKAFAEDRFTKAEQDYQVLKCEYEKSEDYWHMKFQEEVDYYEEERKLYDEKFSALETKIKEYEEMVLNAPGVPVEVPGPNVEGAGGGETGSDDSEDRLSTIDESAVWERQVTDLEEEVKNLQKKLKEAAEERESTELLWDKRLSSEQKKSAQETNRLKAELEHAKAMCRTLENQLTSAREELEQSKRSPRSEGSILPHPFRIHVNGICEKESPVVGAAKSEETTGDAASNGASGQTAAPVKSQAEGPRSGDTTTSSAVAAAVHGAMKAQLSKYQKRIKELEHLLKVSQKCSSEIINQTNERHKAEVQSLQNMMNSTQQVFSTNIVKYKDQLSKVVRGDLLVRELYMENAQLMLALQVTEERQKEAEEQLLKLQMAAQMQGPNL